MNLRRLRGRIPDVIPNVVANNLVLYFLAGFIVVGFVFLNLRRRYAVGTGDLLVEVFGFLLDIMLFGVFLSLYDKWRERRTKIRHYHDELHDFRSWEGQEGVLRKVGIIRRLDEMHAPLPLMHLMVLTQAYLERAHLEGAYLEEANLRGAYLEGAHLEGANLGGANLEEANLSGAYLEEAKLGEAKLRGANLEGANLTGAKGLTWAQLKEARLDDKTKLPDYLKQEEENKKAGIEKEKGEGKK